MRTPARRGVLCRTTLSLASQYTRITLAPAPQYHRRDCGTERLRCCCERDVQPSAIQRYAVWCSPILPPRRLRRSRCGRSGQRSRGSSPHPHEAVILDSGRPPLLGTVVVATLRAHCAEMCAARRKRSAAQRLRRTRGTEGGEQGPSRFGGGARLRRPIGAEWGRNGPPKGPNRAFPGRGQPLRAGPGRPAEDVH
eukprot:scaffold1707_cov357-Prasinococcus_capsulatus_cf.AAC.2